MAVFRRRNFAGEIILWAVRWYCRYGISYRDLEEMVGERGVAAGAAEGGTFYPTAVSGRKAHPRKTAR